MTSTKRVVLALNTRLHSGDVHKGSLKLYTRKRSLVAARSNMVKHSVCLCLVEVKSIRLFLSIWWWHGKMKVSAHFAAVPNMVHHSFSTPEHLHANNTMFLISNVLPKFIFNSMLFARMCRQCLTGTEHSPTFTTIMDQSRWVQQGLIIIDLIRGIA